MDKQQLRKLDEKRVGLLIRMSFHRACVCAKRIQEPLLRRGFVKLNSTGNYELTPSGKKEASKLVKEWEGRHIETYGGISIGQEVMIVQDRSKR